MKKLAFFIFFGLLALLLPSQSVAQLSDSPIDISATPGTTIAVALPHDKTMASPRYDCPPDTVRIFIPDVEMCAGEVRDIPVYLTFDNPARRTLAMQFRFEFPDHEIAELEHVNKRFNGRDTIATGVYTSFDPKLYGSIVTNYFIYDGNYKNYVRGAIFTFATTTFYAPTPGVPLFKMRVRCKSMGTARIECKLNPSAYSAIWYYYEDYKGCGYAPITYNTAHIRPGKRPKVEAMGDTTICVRDKLRLWAEGGVKYLWEDISNVSSPFTPSLSEHRVQYPIFSSVEPGYHRYRVRISDTTGCYDYDTVMCIVKNNTINIDLPQDTIVDSNGIARLDAKIWGDSPPYSIKWEPTELAQISQMSNLVPNSLGKVMVNNLSKPLVEPTMFVVTASGKHCSYAMEQNVNVKGSGVKGYINPFPIIRCAGSTEAEVVRLNVLTRGGIGPFKYNWSYENLEPGTPDPEFESLTMRSPEVVYFSRCVFTVRITDFSSGKMFRISDTIQLKQPVVASIDLINRSGEGPFCEASKFTFTANAKNAGKEPIYSWMINGKELYRSEDTLFVSYDIIKGDTISCVLYSNEECVVNPTQISEPIVPEMEYYASAMAIASFGHDGPDYGTCGDSLSMKILYRNTGRNFRLKWYRNDDTVVYDKMAVSEVEEGDDGVHYASFERNSYYDQYNATITESDRPCLVSDSAFSGKVNAKLNPKKELVAMPPRTSFGSWGDICENSPFIVYADVKYLPKDFTLIWYKQSAGQVAVELGRYSTKYDAYKVNLPDYYASIFISASDAYSAVQDYYRKGFPIYFNQKFGNLEFKAGMGDSIFYTVHVESSSCYGAKDFYSSKMPVTPLPTINGNALGFRILEDTNTICEGVPITVVMETDGIEGWCGWRYNDKAVLIDYPHWVTNFDGRRDTLKIPSIKKTDSLKGWFVTTYMCRHTDQGQVSPFIYKKFNNIKEGLTVNATKDTILCAGESILLSASGANISGSSSMDIKWANSMEDLKNGNFVANGSTMSVLADSSLFGNTSEGYTVDTAIIGVLHKYVQISNTDCKGVDSIKIEVAYNRKPTISIDVMGGNDKWCENQSGQYFKLKGENWGQNPEHGFLTASGEWVFTKSDSIPFNKDYFKNSYPIAAGVLSSMKTCIPWPVDAYSDSIYIDIKEAPVVDMDEKYLKICKGDDIIVQGVGYGPKELADLSAAGVSQEQIFEIFDKQYIHTWTDEEGNVVSNERYLRVKPQKTTTYTLTVQDTGFLCVSASSSIKVDVAVKTGMEVEFTDVETGKRVPFSICDRADSVKLSWRGKPENFSNDAYLGYAVWTKNTQDTRFLEYTNKPDTVFTAWFKPGDEFMYLYQYDTLSCSKEESFSAAIDIIKGRPKSAAFYAGPDTLLCPGESVNLFLKGGRDYVWPSAPMASIMGDSPVLWQPVDGLSDIRSFTPLAQPTEDMLYEVGGYNEFGCFQLDSVRVELYNVDENVFTLAVYPNQRLLCGVDTVVLYIDQNNSSILSSFDSIVWKRNEIPVAKGAFTQLKYDVSNGDSIWVEGYLNGKQCMLASATKSNKVFIEKYEGVQIQMSASKTNVCKGEIVEITAIATPDAKVEWDTIAKKGYEIVSINKVDPSTYKLSVIALSDFSLRAGIYFDVKCHMEDTVSVKVVQSIDSLYMELQTPDVKCNSGDVRLKITQKKNVESWKWYVNNVHIPWGDNYELVDMALSDNDSVFVVGASSALCVNTDKSKSNTVKIIVGAAPDIHWIEPTSLADKNSVAPKWRAKRRSAKGVVLSGCPEEDILFEASVIKPSTMSWSYFDGKNEHALSTTQRTITTENGEEIVYSAPFEYLENNTVIRVSAFDSKGCQAKDSVVLNTLAQTRMELSIKPSSPVVCKDEKLRYSIKNSLNVDSIVWYLNGVEQVSTYTFEHIPVDGDFVYAIGYSFDNCVLNQGLLSDTVRVQIINSDDAQINISLNAPIDSVCSPKAVVYTASGNGYNELYWFANGALVNYSNVSTGSSYSHTPRLTYKEGLDSLYIMAVRKARTCVSEDTVFSNVVSVFRREPPVVTLDITDTTIEAGEAVRLNATGATSFMWWSKTLFEDSDLAQIEVFPTETSIIYAIGYEPYYQDPNGVTLANVTCFSMDTVVIKVNNSTMPPTDEVLIYIPNAIIPDAANPLDRIFKVNAPDVLDIRMEIYNASGNRIYNAHGVDPQWEPKTEPAGNYAYRVWISFKSGKKVEKQGWVSIIR